MFKITRKGSLGVEAAIILPLIILGILTISYLIKINCTNETIMSIAVDEARKLNIESYTPEGRFSATKFPIELKKRIKENSNCSAISTDNFKYLYSNHHMDNLISFSVHYQMDCDFPISFYGPMWGSDTIVTRAFLGSSEYNNDIGFEIMEEIEDPETVWIFPVAGKKYHNNNCPYIKVAATQTVLNNSIKKKYKPCSICKSKNLVQGSKGYCFFNSGLSYHSSNCYTVERYVIEVDKNEAIRRGYIPCLKCGGS